MDGQKKAHALHRKGPEITYTGSIDLKCERGGRVATLCDRELVVHTPLITNP